MLYLEDYLEMIEHLPEELRNRFTEMRELELTVQNNMDELEKRVHTFFNECRRYSGELPSHLLAEYEAILAEYRKPLEDADEKLHLANQMYELVDKYLRRLDTELHKFKCELEADNKGITEVLEKRSLELDTPISAQSNATQQQKENRYESSGGFRYSRHRSERSRRDGCNLTSVTTAAAAAAAAAAGNTTTPTTAYSREEKRHSIPSVSLVEAGAIGGGTSLGLSTPSSSSSLASGSVPAYNLGHIGAGPAIAAAASQAIAATQQMQQGRRTASLKASYEAAINTGGVHGHEFSIGKELAGAAQTALQAIKQDPSSKKKQKRWTGSTATFAERSSAVSSPLTTAAALLAQHSQGATAEQRHSGAIGAPSSSVAGAAVSLTRADSPMDVSPQNADLTDGEWSYDPNEPRYCLCNQVSYGDMVACDNEDCPMEWFHYVCVGITAPPKGKWYCPQCTASMKRRSRKN